MKPSNVFQLEMKTLFSGKRNLALKIGLTLLLGFPFVMVAMPLTVKVSGLMMLVLFTGFFGAAVTLVRRRTDGHTARLKLLPVPQWIILVDFVLSGALIDMLQTGIILALFVIVNGQGITGSTFIYAAGLFCITVVMLNIFGIVLGFVMESNPEVHLAAALTTGFFALISNLFPVPARLDRLIETISRYNPISILSDVLVDLGQDNVVVHDQPLLIPVLILVIFTGSVIFRSYDWGI
ncbi:MAG: ABC transporter permease [Candidatus Latescibacteria bacterium]|nr:ABC transporter permease [Candidatus Latescibacterota bacterium]